MGFLRDTAVAIQLCTEFLSIPLQIIVQFHRVDGQHPNPALYCHLTLYAFQGLFTFTLYYVFLDVNSVAYIIS